MAGAAGAAVALVALGPVSAVVAGVAAAVATTRGDGLGAATRSVGGAVADGVAAVRGFDRRHRIGEKAADVAAALKGRVAAGEAALRESHPKVAALAGKAAYAGSVAGLKPVAAGVPPTLAPSPWADCLRTRNAIVRSAIQCRLYRVQRSIRGCGVRQLCRGEDRLRRRRRGEGCKRCGLGARSSR